MPAMYHPAMIAKSGSLPADRRDTKPAGEALLVAQDLVKQYGDRRVVDGVSLMLGRGETLGLVG